MSEAEAELLIDYLLKWDFIDITAACNQLRKSSGSPGRDRPETRLMIEEATRKVLAFQSDHQEQAFGVCLANSIVVHGPYRDASSGSSGHPEFAE
jgi:hypothetical protein